MKFFVAIAFVLATAACVWGQDDRGSCVCQLTGPRVCGVDNHNYINACTANCRGIEVACEGRCPCVDPCDALPEEPVCGEGGQNFRNRCAADQAGVPIDCEGNCPCSCETAGGDCVLGIGYPQVQSTAMEASPRVVIPLPECCGRYTCCDCDRELDNDELDGASLLIGRCLTDCSHC